MKTELENINSTKKKIKIESTIEEVDHAYSHALKHIRGKANIKGFRPGKVPDNLIEQYYGYDLLTESLNHLIEHSYPKALEEHNLVPVLKPKFNVNPIEKSKTYSYEVELEVQPHFELSEYLGIPLKKKEAQVEESEVEEELKKIQMARAELKPAPEANKLENKGVAVIDFEGTIDSKPMEGGLAKGFQLEMGAGQFLKEFEEKIIGMAIGESRTIEITFPNDYFKEDLRGKKAEFKVTLHSLLTKELPALDDEFAKDLGKESLEALKTEIKEMIIKRKEREFRQGYAEEAIDYLISKHSLDVPEGLLTQEMEAAKREKSEAEKIIRIQFILEAIAKKEGVKLDPADIENRFREFSAMYRQPVAALKKFYQEKNLYPQLVSQILLEKTLDFIIDKATLK